jgi:hypothetical protein
LKNSSPSVKRWISSRPLSTSKSSSSSHLTGFGDTAQVASSEANLPKFITAGGNDAPTYRGSSASALLSQIKGALLHSDPSTRGRINLIGDGEPVGNRYGEIIHSNGVEILQAEDKTEADLPARDFADDLLRCYWEFSHSLFPIVHRETFISSYQMLWTTDSSRDESDDERVSISRNLFHITLNIIFAIGCHFTELINPTERTQYGDRFYQYSRKLINFEILDDVQLGKIQMLLLTAVYLFYEQPSNYPDRCWNVMGLAIRSCQGLGLDLDEPKSLYRSQLDREMRRRTWNCAVLFDRFVPYC